MKKILGYGKLRECFVSVIDPPIKMGASKSEYRGKMGQIEQHRGKPNRWNLYKVGGFLAGYSSQISQPALLCLSALQQDVETR